MHGVMNVSADEYPVPQPVVGRGAVFVEHRLKTPQVCIRAIMGPLDDPGTVFGVGASPLMPGIARRYARGLALHHRDHILPDERHMLAQEDAP